MAEDTTTGAPDTTPDTTTANTTPAADAPQEPTLAQLKKQLAAVTKERDTANGKLEKVTAERDELKRQNREQATELGQAEKLIAEQTEKLAEADAKGGDAIIVTHEKKQYRVIGKQLNVDGHVHTAESLTKNPDVVAALVRSESGFLQLVSK